MLRLSKITKDYRVADTTVQALKGIDLAFRKNEFVSVLGPSGCGKTTLLNIIGGLDKYTSGDVFINGRSTKQFRDRDWDVYRNHRIGFIFQSYNLIPHQTVLGNVELALTIAGMGKAERTERAKRALDRVGLAGQYHKKPNQLSGGQCQRVAIARALVNEPEILLADEPTGALDTTTSVQIMDLIREIAEEKLVIMVTHNPELAEKYSTRIIRLLDGSVVDDTDPYSPEEEEAEVREVYEDEDRAPEQQVSFGKPERKAKKRAKKGERAKMSFWTAFRLSAQNLFTKKARTTMTSIAGAIGIIGVSLVLAISGGVKTYIANMQNDMLSASPIAIEETAYDMSALMQGMSFQEKEEMLKEHGFVNVDSLIEYLVEQAGTADSLMIQNTITQEYIDFVLGLPKEDIATIFLDYGLDVSNNIYTEFRENKGGDAQNISLTAIRSIYTSVLKETNFSKYASYVTSLTENFEQSPSDDEYLLTQYDLLDGKIATGKNEVMIVVNKDTALNDLLLAQLGYYSQDEFINLIYRASDDALYDPSLDKDKFSYEELRGKKFTWYPNNEIFDKTGEELMPFTYSPSTEGFDQGLELEIVGILQPKENISYGCLSSGFYYTEALAKYAISENLESEVVDFLRENDLTQYTSPAIPGQNMYGISFQYTYTFNGETKNAVGYVGTGNPMSAMMGGGSADIEIFTLSLQQLGGVNLANGIFVYPLDFEHKDNVLAYLDRWNSEETIEVNGVPLAPEDRDKITYTDNLSVIIDMVNGMVEIVTIALIGFTALSLVVSCVMIAIITYVSVVERIKEIGVIRSLGGRKKDVSRLFTAETFIIGLFSGLIGIAVTYLLSLIINLVVASVSVISAIAILPVWQALVMVCVSVLLTLISGVFPARAAARKDPVVALRTE